MKRILVTGGAGFISSAFIRHLLRATPYEVVSLDALTYAGNLENLRDVRSHERLSFVHGDIRDEALVREVVAGVDVIVNAAAESHVEKSIAEGASEFVATNVQGTRVLLDAIREEAVERFILISSSEVYGTAEAAPMNEEHPLNPRSPYAATKAGADRLAFSYRATYDLPIVIVRPFNNYGPRQHPEKVIPRFILQALAGEPLTVHGDGTASRDWLYVEDDAEAIQAVIEADAAVGRRRGDQRRDGAGRVGVGDRRPRAGAVREAGDAEGARGRAAGPGGATHRLDGEGGTAARVDCADAPRRGPEPHRRLVSRERVLGGLVPCGSGRRRAHDLSSEPVCSAVSAQAQAQVESARQSADDPQHEEQGLERARTCSPSSCRRSRARGTEPPPAARAPFRSVFSRFDHALEIRTIAMPKSQPMNGTTSVTIAATSSLPVGRCSASGAGSAASTISSGGPSRSSTLRTATSPAASSSRSAASMCSRISAISSARRDRCRCAAASSSRLR